jgi:hypothetical protein
LIEVDIADELASDVGDAYCTSMSGKRVLSLATIAMAFGAAALWVSSRQYVIAAIWALIGAGWLIRTALEWKAPVQQTQEHAGRDQLIIGAMLLAGVLAWIVWSPSSPFAIG